VNQDQDYRPNPDRSKQYTDTNPATLLSQLNENWKRVRIVESAVADRDRIIDRLHGSVAERDTTIRLLNSRLRLSKVRVALLYALVGGAAAKGIEALVVALVHLFLRWIQQP
jgi:hypothetical protein